MRASNITDLLKGIKILDKTLKIEINLKNYELNSQLIQDFEDLNYGDYDLTLQFYFSDEFLIDSPIVTILKPNFDVKVCTMLN